MNSIRPDGKGNHLNRQGVLNWRKTTQQISDSIFIKEYLMVSS